jgi:hypothetical protein
MINGDGHNKKYTKWVNENHEDRRSVILIGNPATNKKLASKQVTDGRILRFGP